MSTGGDGIIPPFPALLTQNHYTGAKQFLSLFHDHPLPESGSLIQLLPKTLILNYIHKLNSSGMIGQNGVDVWNPFEEDFVLLHLSLVLDLEGSSIRHTISSSNPSPLIEQVHLPLSSQHHHIAIFPGHRFYILIHHLSFAFCGHLGLLFDPGCGSTNMEGA